MATFKRCGDRDGFKGWLGVVIGSGVVESRDGRVWAVGVVWTGMGRVMGGYGGMSVLSPCGPFEMCD